MRALPTAIEGVLVVEPKVFRDDRGWFMESYNQRLFQELAGQDVRFVQDNHSRSSRGVLRGLHYQLPPHAQGKLVRVIRGAVFDVAVDMRKESPTFARWVGVELSAENQRQCWIPVGCAHGFLVVSDVAELLYKTTDYYAPQSEASVRWDDPDLAIAWPAIGHAPLLSAKDAMAPALAQAQVFHASQPGAR